MAKTPTALAPHSPGNNWAYWKVNDLRLTSLIEAWKRRRNTIDFIPTEDALKCSRAKHYCSYCGARVTTTDASAQGKGVRGIYSPRHKRMVLMHYQCAWQGTLEAIHNLSRSIA